MNGRVLTAVFRKELAAYFSNPTGYVFITLFVFLSGVAAFWTEQFFARNLANLDALNAWMGALLLFIVPAITMGAWAEERKQGTDELLLTLPAREGEIVLGKYLGCVAIFGVCLLFAASHILVLGFLGRPDVGLMISTYVGYFLAGAALCGVGLAASSLSASPTISFVTAAVACGGIVGIGLVGGIVPGGRDLLGDWLVAFSLPARIEAFGRGVVRLGDVAYCLGIGLAGAWLATRIITRRRWARGGVPPAATGSEAPGLHLPLRLAALAAALAFGVTLLDRSGVRADATAERLWSLSPQTRELLSKIAPDQPIAISAYVSPRVPAVLVQQRETLLGLLREVQAAAGGRVQVSVIDTEPSTEAARQAERSYGIRPRPIVFEDEGAGAVRDVFMGVAVSGGGGKLPSVVPFLAQGLSAEYELARAIRAAGAETRQVVGILETDAGLLGKFDFQTMSPPRDWAIVTELRKQYDVRRVAPGATIGPEIEVLVVAQPSSLRVAELDRLLAYLREGRPALIMEDPLPLVNPAIATTEPRRPPNPMMGMDPSASEPKADLTPLWNLLGARVAGDAVVWDKYNPHPEIGQTPEEFLWVARAAPWSAASPPFNDEHPISAGLQECVLLFAGRIDRVEPPAPAAPAGDAAAAPPTPPTATEFTTLVRSGPASLRMPYAQILQRSFMGASGLNPARRPVRPEGAQTLAAHLRGGPSRINAVLVSDLDLVGEQFFQIREQGGLNVQWDNVTFVLNAVDELAGERALLDLRKKRREHRTLERLEARRLEESRQIQTAIDAAGADADARLAEAQARLDAKVAEVEGRTDVDDTTRQIMLESVRRAEQRRLDAASAAIGDARRQSIEDARLAAKTEIDAVQTRIRLAAVLLPPIPALAIGAIVAIRRRRLERASGRLERFEPA